MSGETETNKEAAERGYESGKIDARLSAHDHHFAEINGSVTRLGNEVHALVLAVQRLGDEARANAATVVTTAAALKAAEEARRDKSEQTWTPFQRGMAVLVAISAAVAILAALGVFR